MPRKAENFIDSFYEFTDLLPSPQLFRRWAGIALVAGTLQRRTWINTGGLFGNLYPNLYTIFVAPPGVGKTVLTSLMYDFWAKLNIEGHAPKFHLGSSSLTAASMGDELRDAEVSIIRMGEPDPLIKYNALTICSNELGVLLPEFDNTFMNRLTDLYDGKVYSERRRSKDLNFRIEHPQLNFIAATTPGFLTEMLPQGAWDQGFLARTFLIYSGEIVRRELFSQAKLRDDLQKDLIGDLRIIGDLYGEYKFEETAAKNISAWHMAGGPPAPEHPRLMNYLTRRTAHLLKLSMIAAAASGDSLIILDEHVKTALGWLLELELYLPDIFKAVTAGGASRAIDEVWHFAYSTWIKESKPILEHRLVEFLQNRVPIHEVLRILEVMERAGILKPELLAGGGKAYRPRPRNDR